MANLTYEKIIMALLMIGKIISLNQPHYNNYGKKMIIKIINQQKIKLIMEK